MTNFKLQSKTRENVQFELYAETKIGVYNSYQKFKLLPVDKYVLIKEVQGKRCMCLTIDTGVKPYIKNTFEVDVKSGEVYLQITDESWDLVQSIEADFKVEVEAFKAELQKRSDVLPVKYYMYDCLDWGDYTSNEEREIQIWREALPEERGEETHVKSHKLWNKSIGDHGQEWDKDIEASGGKVGGGKIEISKELAEKWIGFWQIIQEQKAAEEAVGRTKAEDRKRKEDEKRQNIESGCIYFHCESSPHTEDLSKVILNRPAPNGGSFTIQHRVSDSLFSRIKSFGRYYNAEFLEDCDMFTSSPGWRFSEKAVNELLKTNKVFIDNIEVK